MDLAMAATFFNDTKCSDAYTGQYLYDGQLDVYTEGVRDGVAVQRRVLELAPGLMPPDRRCVVVEGEPWILGVRNVDSFRGDVIRQKFAMHRSEGVGTYQSLYGVLTQAEPVQAHMGRVWTRTIKEINEDSDETNMLTIYMALYETVQARQIISIGGANHIVKETYPSTAGFRAAVVEQIEGDLVVDLVVESKGMDPVTEQPIPGQTYKALALRWQSDFKYHSQMTPKFQPGDVQFVVEETADIVNGSVFTAVGQRWRAQNVAHDQGQQVKFVHGTRQP